VKTFIRATSLLAVAALVGVTSVASADPFVAQHCDQGDPLCTTEPSPSPSAAVESNSPPSALAMGLLVQLAQNPFVRRSAAERTLTADDRAALRALGLTSMHAAAVVIRKIPRHEGAQLARIEKLVRAVDMFGPSGACDAIAPEGPGKGTCNAKTDASLGKVSVRTPFAVKLDKNADGSARIMLTNVRAMEIHPFLSWSPIVEKDHLKMSIDLLPVSDGFVVYAKMGVDMLDHTDAAAQIVVTLEKLERWLSADLARR
jgi:hypothetical protein